jgi:N-acetylglucosamine-6-sulfatase
MIMFYIKAAGLMATLLLAANLAVIGPEPRAREASTTSVAAGDEARRLNIVFIVSDDERVEGTAAMHDVESLLARHGVTFSNFDVTTSECGPSRAAILTGQYGHHNGVTDNFGPHGYPGFDKSSNLAVWLQQAGYDNALVGKYLNDYSLEGNHEIPPGWNDWQAIDSVPLEKYYDYDLNENGTLVHYGDAPSDYSTSVLTGKAVQFLRTARKPFFLYFAPVAPHLPAVPAPQDAHALAKLAPLTSPSLNQSDVAGEPWAAWHSRTITTAGVSYTDAVRRHQLQSLLSLDRAVKRIVGTLATRHLLDRTVIFYTSDNGFLWGEHRLGGKLWPYQESTHVPLIVRTPWTDGDGTSTADPVLNIDFASTISELAGIRPELPQDGRSFVPMLHGLEMRWRSSYLIEYLGENKLEDGGPPPYVAIRTRRYLYVRYRYHGWQELYDVRRDPWQLHNLAHDPAYASLLPQLRTRLAKLLSDPPHVVA